MVFFFIWDFLYHVRLQMLDDLTSCCLGVTDDLEGGFKNLADRLINVQYVVSIVSVDLELL